MKAVCPKCGRKVRAVRYRRGVKVIGSHWPATVKSVAKAPEKFNICVGTGTVVP